MKFPASGHGLKNTKVLFNFLLIVNVFHSNCSLFIKKWSTSAFNSCVSLCWFGHYLADMNSSRCEKIDGKKIIPLICWRIQYSKKCCHERMQCVPVKRHLQKAVYLSIISIPSMKCQCIWQLYVIYDKKGAVKQCVLIENTVQKPQSVNVEWLQMYLLKKLPKQTITVI